MTFSFPSNVCVRVDVRVNVSLSALYALSRRMYVCAMHYCFEHWLLLSALVVVNFIIGKIRVHLFCQLISFAPLFSLSSSAEPTTNCFSCFAPRFFFSLPFFSYCSFQLPLVQIDACEYVIWVRRRVGYVCGCLGACVRAQHNLTALTLRRVAQGKKDPRKSKKLRLV